MTEGLGAFRNAISNLEGAAGGANNGMVMAEDGSMVPASFYSDDPRTAAEIFSDQNDDFRFANMDSRPEADPGYAWAEDGTQVPIDYWD